MIFLALPPSLRHRFAPLAALVLAAGAPSTAQPPATPAADSLDLAQCLDAALQSNRELKQGREQIAQVEGDRVVVRSRLMPQLRLDAGYDARRTERLGSTQDDLASQLLFQQRLFEFGPDAAAEIQLRADLRQAVFDYEGKVYEIAARVWELYHLILLQDAQLAVRRSSRDSFEEIYQRQSARFSERLASEEDKLNAELLVLSEELEINRLLRQQFNNRMELLRLIGRPIGVDLALRGERAVFAVDQDQAVAFALARDTQIHLDEQLLDEQRRVARELGWEYAPDLAVDAGVEDGRRHASVSVDRQARTWGVNMESGLALSEDEAPRSEDGATWTAKVQASIPLFEGGARIGREALEQAKLRRLQLQLRDLRAGVELRVRQAYQSMLEAEETQRLQEQRVRIARRRLEIGQLLQEKGQADEAKLEQIRDQFFDAQVTLFNNQATYISRQAQLRRLMGYVE